MYQRSKRLLYIKLHRPTEKCGCVSQPISRDYTSVRMRKRGIEQSACMPVYIIITCFSLDGPDDHLLHSMREPWVSALGHSVARAVLIFLAHEERTLRLHHVLG